MGLYITGDTHGDFSRFNKEPYTSMTKDDIVIICGDFGGLWRKDADHAKKMEILNSVEFTILWIDGNHENFDWLNEFEVKEWNGGKVHFITDKCIHLIRGQVFNIEGKNIFTYGGASSVDRMYRIPGVSWWAEELPSWKDESEALKNLEKCNYKVDLVITHSAPNNILYKINPSYYYDSVTTFLHEIYKKLSFKHWYIGHYHEDRDITNKVTLLWFDTILEED